MTPFEAIQLAAKLDALIDEIIPYRDKEEVRDGHRGEMMRGTMNAAIDRMENLSSWLMERARDAAEAVPFSDPR
jgi:hypothetical protein